MLAGRYRLDREIGHGAMGSVCDAYDEVLRRRVAIKQVDFPPGMPAAEVEQLADRTLREARAIAALSHPHVVTLYDILTPPSGPVIVMELLAARSLAQVLAQEGPLDVGRTAAIGQAVAAGLMAAHAAGITHRDVKPGNVLIGDDGRIKLTDFGIARSVDEHTMTATGLLLGSPAYISPEVAAGSPATPAADAWGLGALLYACVEGRPPYDRGEPIATLTAVVTDPVPPHPRSGRLSRIIDALLVKDPSRRMPVDEALIALVAVASAAPAAAPVRFPPGPVTPQRAGIPADRRGDSGATRPGGPAQFRTDGPAAARPGDQGPRPSDEPSVRLTDQRSAPRDQRTVRAGNLPPPPWADQDARRLAALPATAPPRRLAPLLATAFLIFAAAAAAGFFGVLAIARLG
jgi:serine/threonine protein kinase